MYIVMDLEFNCSNNSYVSEKNGVRLTNEIIEKEFYYARKKF